MLVLQGPIGIRVLWRRRPESRPIRPGGVDQPASAAPPIFSDQKRSGMIRRPIVIMYQPGGSDRLRHRNWSVIEPCRVLARC